jgi:hypothetical protein
VTEMNALLPVLCWAVDLAAPFGLGVSFRYSMQHSGQRPDQPEDGHVVIGAFSSSESEKVIVVNGAASVIYNQACRRWFPASVVFSLRKSDGVFENHMVTFTCVAEDGKIVSVTMTLGAGERVEATADPVQADPRPVS